MKLLSSTEIKRVLKAIKDSDVPIASVDIRADGILISLPGESVGSAFDAWKKSNDRTARR